MKKQFLKLILVISLLLSGLSPVLQPAGVVLAAPASLTVYSSASDGRIYNTAAAVWATARATTTATVGNTSKTTTIGGGYKDGSNWYISRGFFFFDTSGIPDNAVISAASVYLYPTANYSGDAQSLYAVYGGPTYPHDPLVGTDFDVTKYTGIGGQIASTAWIAGAYREIALNSTGLAWISVTGTTKIGFMCSKDYDNSAPSATSEFVGYYAEQDGTSSDPYISVTYYVPDPTTAAATNVEINTAQINGVAPTNGSAWSVKFQYGLTAAYGTNTSYQSGLAASATFNASLSGLSGSTAYHYRVVCNISTTEWVSADATFTTDSGTPTTQAASSISTTAATLNGTTSANGSDWDMKFQYGTTTGYGTDTSWTEGLAASTSSTQAIGSLSPGTLYHFRAVTRDVIAATYNGSDATFLTLPVVPTGFTCTRGDTQATLSWTKGDGADKTMVRRGTTTYPVNISDGTQVYFDTDPGVTDSGLTNDVTYYYSAWSEITTGGLTQYSSTYVTGSATPGIAAMDPPDTLSIEDARVYTGYKETGDQLYVISYKVIYATTPTEDVEDYFNLDILDGGVLKARVKLPFWGYRPASIYLSASGALTWGSTYTIKIVGVEDMWEAPPETTYSLTSLSWEGADLVDLDEWVITMAESMENYYSIPGDLTDYVPGFGTILSADGGDIFRASIPSLGEIRSNLFTTGIGEIDITSTLPGDTYAASRNGSFGTTVMTAFTNLGEHLGGVSGTVIAGVFWFIILLLVAGIATAVTSSPVIGIIACLPIMFIGNFLGVIPMAIMGIIGVFAVVFLLMQLWLARS